MQIFIGNHTSIYAITLDNGFFFWSYEYHRHRMQIAFYDSPVL